MKKREFTDQEVVQLINVMVPDIMNLNLLLSDIYKKNTVNHVMLTRILYQCKSVSPEIEFAREMWEGARTIRAQRYAEDAKRVMDDVVPFIETPSGAGLRDSSASVAKAKYQSDIRFKFAASLDPLNWGDYQHELRVLQRELNELKKLIESKYKK